MTTIIHAVTAPCAKQSGVPLDLASDQIDRETLTATAESIVRDILQIVAAGRIDDEARAAFRDWIIDAWLALPTAQQTLAPHCVWCSAGVEQLCQAAGFAGPVDPETMKCRVDELHATIAAQRQELAQCHEHIATLRAAGQAIAATWEQGDLAYAVRHLAALLPR